MKTGFLIFLLACLSLSAMGQETTGQINGVVLDSQGAALTKAQVTVTNPSTGFTRSTVTEGAGNYSVPSLPPGTYNVRIQAPGFAIVDQKGVELRVGQSLTLNQTLKPGAATEVVEVNSSAQQIETSSSEIGGSVSPTEVSSLPILDRNFSGLETLIPGVRPAEGFDPTKTRVGNVSINGGDGRQLDTNVDGGDNKDLVVGGMVQNFTMEGIQEFNVITDHYSAEAGHSVAGIVNVVSKSGTNNYHGSAFGLMQLSTLNRTNFFEAQRCATTDPSNVGRCKSVFHRYHYGGSVGGPIKKDKLFFFGAFEQKREQGGLSANPTTFASLTSFANQTANFPGGPYAFPVATLPFSYIDDQATVKLDYKINDKQNMFVRYGRQKWTNPNDQLGNTNSPFTADASQSNTDTNNFHDLTIAHNYTISSNKVNSLNVHFQDMVNAILASPTHSFTYPLADGSTTTNPNILFSDGSNSGLNTNVPQETLIRKYQLRDDFNWMKGKHNFKFGGNWIYFAKMGGFFFSALGYNLTFFDDPICIAAGSCPQTGALYPQGLSTPGAVREVTFNSGSASTAQPPWHSLGLYFQDDYKVTPHLTLNLGLRWDANIKFLQPLLGDSLTDSNKGVFTMRQTLAALGGSLAGDPGVERMQQIVGDTSLLHRTTSDWKEFQPRIGFAWDMTGTGKSVIRGGYGIARDQIFQNITLFSIQQTQPTIYQTVLDTTADQAPGQGCSTAPIPGIDICNFRFGIDPLPAAPPPQPNLAFGATPRIVNPRITDPWSQQASIGFAYQIHPDYAFSVDYYHILGTHEERVLNANPVLGSVCNPAFGGNTADPRCVAGVGTRLMDLAFQTANTCADDGTCGAGLFNKMYLYSTTNRSMYDGLNFQLKKRMTNRFMFQASYVLSWSRAWGGFPTASYGGSGLAVRPEQQFQPNEFNRTNFDERNRVVLSGVFNLPGGIQLSPLFQAASARPYSLLAGGFDVDGDGRGIIDRACAGSTAAAPIVTPGCTMLKPNTQTGKPFVQMDLRTTKNFRMGEHANLAIYWEFYNLFNRANFCNSYEQDVNAPNFNQPQSFCGGPSNAANGGVSGASASAIPSLHSQFGLRFEF